MTKRRRYTPDQIIRKIAEGHKLLAGGRAGLLPAPVHPASNDKPVPDGPVLGRSQQGDQA